jgi:hypothetical protein
MMEAARTSETSVDNHFTGRCCLVGGHFLCPCDNIYDRTYSFAFDTLYFHVIRDRELPKLVVELLTLFFVFGRSRAQISARRQAILSESFRGFTQSHQSNSWIVP